MKPIDVKFDTYYNTDKELNNKDPKCKIGGHVRMLKH